MARRAWSRSRSTLQSPSPTPIIGQPSSPPRPAAATANGSAVTVTAAHTPDTVSASTALTTTYFGATVTVKNTGAKTAKNVVVTDTPPSGSSAVSASSTVGACTLGANVTCSVG